MAVDFRWKLGRAIKTVQLVKSVQRFLNGNRWRTAGLTDTFVHSNREVAALHSRILFKPAKMPKLNQFTDTCTCILRRLQAISRTIRPLYGIKGAATRGRLLVIISVWGGVLIS